MGGIRTNVVLVLPRVVQRTVRAHPARTYIPLRYAINELHESILTSPEIRREIATVYVQELSLLREPGMKRGLDFSTTDDWACFVTSKWC